MLRNVKTENLPGLFTSLVLIVLYSCVLMMINGWAGSSTVNQVVLLQRSMYVVAALLCGHSRDAASRREKNAIEPFFVSHGDVEIRKNPSPSIHSRGDDAAALLFFSSQPKMKSLNNIVSNTRRKRSSL